MKCEVCLIEDETVKKRRGCKRVLCFDCYDAAVDYTNVTKDSKGGSNWYGHLPADRGFDPYEGRSRYAME